MSPAICRLTVTPGWEVLAGRSFCSGNGHWVPEPREGSHTPREPPHSFSVMFALLERALESWPVCTLLGYCGQNTLGAHLKPGPRGPNRHFSPTEP